MEVHFFCRIIMVDFLVIAIHKRGYQQYIKFIKVINNDGDFHSRHGDLCKAGLLFRYPRNYIPPMVLMHCYATNRYRHSYICHLIYIQEKQQHQKNKINRLHAKYSIFLLHLIWHFIILINRRMISRVKNLLL